jgi:outer membrane protein OmpA-like peptidoglycan-associated protein
METTIRQKLILALLFIFALLGFSRCSEDTHHPKDHNDENSHSKPKVIHWKKEENKNIIHNKASNNIDNWFLSKKEKEERARLLLLQEKKIAEINRRIAERKKALLEAKLAREREFKLAIEQEDKEAKEEMRKSDLEDLEMLKRFKAQEKILDIREYKARAIEDRNGKIEEEIANNEEERFALIDRKIVEKEIKEEELLIAKAEDEAQKRYLAEQEIRQKEEAKRKAEEEARLAAIKAEQERIKASEEEARKLVQEQMEKKRAIKEKAALAALALAAQRAKAEEEAQERIAQEEAKRKAEEEAKRRAEEERLNRLRAKEEEMKKFISKQMDMRDNAAPLTAMAIASVKTSAKEKDEEILKEQERLSKLRAEEAKRKAEEEARLAAIKAEQERIAQEEAKRKAEEEAKRRAEEEKKRAEEEARRKAEEERLAKLKAEEEAKAKLKEELHKTFKSAKIEFKYNSTKLQQKSIPILDKVAKLIKQNPQYLYEIQGHTDARGDEDYNIKLSQKRAEKVKEYFIKKGIDANILFTKGYGSSKPIADNLTNEGRLKNRRVVIEIIEQ